MKNKVLLFSNYYFDNHSGGPVGFIQQNILSNKINGLITLQNLQEIYRPSLIKKIENIYYNKILQPILSKINSKKFFEYTDFIDKATRAYQYYNCKKYDYIFFHDVISLYACLKKIPSKQKVILQSHAPQLVSEEFEDFGASKEAVTLIKQIEKIAFEKADYLVFPNHNSQEIYKSIISKKNKIYYILSASQQLKNHKSLSLIQTDINILFIGRRNKIKGFNILLETFKAVRLIRQDLNLFLAGDGTEVKDDGITYLGKVDPAIWIASVDYVINVNACSYFDLSVMEVLSIGTPLILTLTGGHLFFKQQSAGIITLNCLEKKSLYNTLINIQRLSEKEKALMIEANQNLYKKYFTVDLYKHRLENFISQLN